jgi:uncharacterized protein (DUF2225 family)
MERVGNGRDTFFLNTDKKYMFERSSWLEQLLRNDSINICFEIHYLNSRKAKTFITGLKILFEHGKAKLESNPDYDFHTLAVLEEAQNSYGTYNLNDDSALEALSILSMGRTDANLHFLAITQRLAETSVKITERLRLISGLQIGFNSINRVKAQITPELKELVQRLPPRTFLYVNGKQNPIFQIPEYSFKGKLKQILPQIEQQPEKKKVGFLRALWNYQKLNYEAGKRKYQANHPEKFQKWDPSINDPSDPEATGESDVEEDSAFLEESDTGW